MQALRRGPGAAVIDVDPDRLDLELGGVAEAEVGALESRLAVDPGLEDAVFLAQRVELAVHLDAVPAIVLQGRVELEDVAVFALHVGVVAVVADLGGVGAGPLEVAAGGPAVTAVHLAATPAGLAIGGRNARQLAAIRGLLPVRIELQVVAKVDLFRLPVELLPEPEMEVRPRVRAARDRDLEALALTPEGSLAIHQRGVGRRALQAPRPPPLRVFKVAGQNDILWARQTHRRPFAARVGAAGEALKIGS